MNELMTKIDKYKYGLFFIVAFFIVVSSVRVKFGFIERPDISHLLNKKVDDIIELKLEPIEMVEQRMNATGDVKNVARDENSDGSSSANSDKSSNYESYYGSAKSLNDVEQSVYELEKSFFNEAGGSEKRAEIQKEIDQRKKEQENNKNKNTQNTNNNSKNTAGNASSGKVLVSYSVSSRTGQYVPAPGYMCPQGTSGTVIINIKVDPSGKVIESKVNSASSSDGCMTSYALEFANKSKFNYTATSGIQEGTITYTFVN